MAAAGDEWQLPQATVQQPPFAIGHELHPAALEYGSMAPIQPQARAPQMSTNQLLQLMADIKLGMMLQQERQLPKNPIPTFSHPY